MDDQNDLLKIGEFSTGWHSHTDVLDAAKALQDQGFTVFLDKVESILEDFKRFFEFKVNDQNGDFYFCRRSDSNAFAQVAFQSQIQLLYRAWDIAKAHPKAKMLNEFDGKLIRSFGLENEPTQMATAFFTLNDELAKHKTLLAKHEERSSLRRTARQPLKANATTDSLRLEFYENLKASNVRTTYKVAAQDWRNAHKDDCDEGAFKQSCYRARKKRDSNKS